MSCLNLYQLFLLFLSIIWVRVYSIIVPYVTAVVVFGGKWEAHFEEKHSEA